MKRLSVILAASNPLLRRAISLLFGSSLLVAHVFADGLPFDYSKILYHGFWGRSRPNPSEWTREEVLDFPGSVDGPWARYVHDPDSRGIGTVRYPRLVPRDADCAAKLAKRTLTNLYNQRPTWLDLAHRKLDEAIFAAYGWDPAISDEEILEKVLELNQAGAGRA